MLAGVLPRRILGLIACVEKVPQSLHHNERQRHSQKQTTLCDEKRCERIAPTEIVSDGVIARQIHHKTANSIWRIREVLSEPPKAQSAAEEKQQWSNFSSDAIAS